ncbi:MAG: hypothetical protein ACRDNZ_23055 [Streptosporangiaceae bacterium]
MQELNDLPAKKAIGGVFYASAAARGEALADALYARREAPMDQEVKLTRGNDRISRLAQRPGIAADVARIRAGMAEADRTYAMGLAALRQAAEMT